MRVIAFYSYKGGVGRSLALVSFAHHAARHGKKVVALDFDLEAPGLHYKFLKDEAHSVTRGVADYLHPIATDYEEPDPVSVSPYLRDVLVDQPAAPGGWIKLFPAGAAPRNPYWLKMEDFRWRDFFMGEPDWGPEIGGIGLSALWTLRHRIEEETGADYLLIDCRTGLTELGGVVMSHISDGIVALMTGADEQVIGARAVLRSAYRTEPDERPGERPAPRLLVALSRIPVNEPNQESLKDKLWRKLTIPTTAEEWGDTATETDQLRLPLAAEDVFILHSLPELQVRERIIAAMDEDNALSRDYGKLFFAIDSSLPSEVAAVNDDRMETLLEKIQDARLRQDLSSVNDIARRVMSAFDKKAQPSQEVVNQAVKAFRIAIDANDAAGSARDALLLNEFLIRLLRRHVDLDFDQYMPDLAVALQGHAIGLSALGRREEALAAAQEALDLRRSLADARPDAFTPALADSLSNIAAFLNALGRREEALAAAQEALALRRRLAAARPDAFTPDLASSLSNIAAFLNALGRREEALAASDEAVGTMLPFFEKLPAAWAHWMGPMTQQWLLCCEALGRTPDPARLARIEAGFQRLSPEDAAPNLR